MFQQICYANHLGDGKSKQNGNQLWWRQKWTVGTRRRLPCSLWTIVLLRAFWCAYVYVYFSTSVLQVIVCPDLEETIITRAFLNGVLNSLLSCSDVLLFGCACSCQITHWISLFWSTYLVISLGREHWGTSQAFKNRSKHLILALPSLIKCIGFALGLFWFVWVRGCVLWMNK